MRQPRTAIIHYWLVGMRGGERVLERLIHLYPDADLFTHVYVPEAVSDVIRARPVKTSFVNKLPRAARYYQKYLPLMPLALEQLDLSGYDLVISSESGPAKGVIAPIDALHVCYCHSPMRYLWDHYHDYRATAGRVTRTLMPLLLHPLRTWDTVSAARVDRIAANSSFVQKRIHRAWGRDSTIIHPPIDASNYRMAHEIGGHYLWVGQMTRYKRADIAVDAFNTLGLPLLMVGDGDLSKQIRQRAGSNIRIENRLSHDALRAAYAECRALVFTAEEDFGIVPVEAMAAGRPVLAFGRGGARDSVVDGETGLFFAEQTAESLIEGVEALERWLPHFDPQAAVRQARRFSPEQFDEGMRALVRG